MNIQIKVDTRMNALPRLWFVVLITVHIFNQCQGLQYEGIWRFLLLSCKDLLDVEHMEAENEI